MLSSYLRLMRPGDWVKNVFVLPALVFTMPRILRETSGDMASAISIADMLIATSLALIAFCLVSSGVYALNDAHDVADDRQHPVKRTRPIASGSISVTAGIIFGVSLLIAGLGVASVVSFDLILVLATYLALQLLYTFVLKNIVLVDVTAVAIGFVLRAVAGAVAIEVQVSAWLLLCVFFLCLFLGLTKRLCDLTSAEHAGVSWTPRAGYRDRRELDWLLGVTGAIAVVMYLAYAMSSHSILLFGEKSVVLSLLSPLVVIVIHRFYRHASQGTSDSPLAVLQSDGVVMTAAVLYCIGVGITLYLPGVDAFIERIFLIVPGLIVSGIAP